MKYILVPVKRIYNDFRDREPERVALYDSKTVIEAELGEIKGKFFLEDMNKIVELYKTCDTDKGNVMFKAYNLVDDEYSETFKLQEKEFKRLNLISGIRVNTFRNLLTFKETRLGLCLFDTWDLKTDIANINNYYQLFKDFLGFDFTINKDGIISVKSDARDSDSYEAQINELRSIYRRWKRILWKNFIL